MSTLQSDPKANLGGTDGYALGLTHQLIVTSFSFRCSLSIPKKRGRLHRKLRVGGGLIGGLDDLGTGLPVAIVPSRSVDDFKGGAVVRVYDFIRRHRGRCRRRMRSEAEVMGRKLGRNREAVSPAVRVLKNS